MNSIRQLCAELVEKLAQYDSADPYHDCASLLERARAALAENAGGPSDEKLMDMWATSDGWINEGATPTEFRTIARAVLTRFGRCVPAPAPIAKPSDEQIAELAAECLGYETIPRDCDGGAVEAYRSELIFFARELLARFGTTSAPPAEGEATEASLPPRIGHILRLAEIIREVDSDNSLGADALAEAILSHPDAASCGFGTTSAPSAEGEAAELAARIRHFLAGYKQIRGLDPEYVYSIHRGDAMEAHIRVSDLTRTADLLERLATPPRQVPTFEEAWKQLGYQYGADALECVRLGWDLRSDCDGCRR